MYTVNFWRRICKTALPLLSGNTSHPPCAIVSLTAILTVSNTTWIVWAVWSFSAQMCLSQLTPLEEEATTNLIKKFCSIEKSDSLSCLIRAKKGHFQWLKCQQHNFTIALADKSILYEWNHLKLFRSVYELWVCLAEYVLKCAYNRWEKSQPQTVNGFLHLSIVFCHYCVLLPTIAVRDNLQPAVKETMKRINHHSTSLQICLALKWNKQNSDYFKGVCFVHRSHRKQHYCKPAGRHNNNKSEWKKALRLIHKDVKPEWKVKRWEVNFYCPIIF